jgi:F-type H+-transporting ATPase subunit gamma
MASSKVPLNSSSVAALDLSMQSSDQSQHQGKKYAKFCSIAALGAAVGMIGALASHQHATQPQMDHGIINLKLGCVKDHLGSVHEARWTPSGILDSNSDMIGDCQVTRADNAIGSVEKFLPTRGLPTRVAPAKAPLTKVSGGSLGDLRDRIGTVKNTKKITSAMQLVAAAKVRRAQEAVIGQRPFSQALERILGGLLDTAKKEAPDMPLLAERTVKKVGLVVVAGDRGLCGGYNNNAIKKAEQRIEELKKAGVEVELILVGDKLKAYFQRRETPIKSMMPIGQAPTAEQSTGLAQELLNSYLDGEIDRVELIYTTFVSMISSVPQIRTLVPLLPDGLEMEGDEIFMLTSKGEGEFGVERETLPVAEPMEVSADTIFEQEPAQLLDSILTLYLNGQILRSLQESVASELASRMTAMQSATDNAGELQENLERRYNRARQAKITQELMEIIAGADAR